MAGRKDEKSSGGKKKLKKSRCGQCVRWVAALVVAILAVAYMIYGTAHESLCHGAIAGESGGAVKLCGAPGLTQLLPFVLVIGVLLAPDLSELAIPGLLAIKRRVEEQGTRQDRIEAELVRVEQKIALRQDVRVQNILEVGARFEEKIDWLVGAVEGLQLEEEEEEEDEDGGEGSGGSAVGGPPPKGPAGGLEEAPEVEASELAEIVNGEEDEGAEEGPESGLRAPGAGPEGVSAAEDQRASQTLQLLWLMKNLEQYESMARARRIDPTQKMAHLSDEQQERVDRWAELFGEELAAAKAVRNAVAHNPYAASIEELEEATRIGRRLMRILLTGLGISTAEIDHLEET